VLGRTLVKGVVDIAIDPHSFHEIGFRGNETGLARLPNSREHPIYRLGPMAIHDTDT
jgi:hypothetical protein